MKYRLYLARDGYSEASFTLFNERPAPNESRKGRPTWHTTKDAPRLTITDVLMARLFPGTNIPVGRFVEVTVEMLKLDVPVDEDIT